MKQVFNPFGSLAALAALIAAAIAAGCCGPVPTQPVSLLQPSRTGEIQWGEPSGGVQVGIAANKLVYLPPASGRLMGDPVVLLTCCMRNVGTEPVRILNLRRCLLGEAELEVTSHGQRCDNMAKGLYLDWPGPPPDAAYVSLSPGQVHEGTLALNAIDWRLPPHFEAEVRFHYSGRQPGNQGLIYPTTYPTRSRRHIAGLWIGEARSNTVRIKVGVLDGATPGFADVSP